MVAQGFNPGLKKKRYSTALARNRLSETWCFASKMETNQRTFGLKCPVREDTNSGEGYPRPLKGRMELGGREFKMKELRI